MTPGYSCKLRSNASARPIAVYETWSTPRRIVDLTGELVIVENQNPEHKVGTILDLPAPVADYASDCTTLRITSACSYAHAIRTAAGALNGNASVIELAGTGASVELFAFRGKWLVRSANAGVSIN